MESWTSYSTKDIYELLAEMEFVIAQGREIQKKFKFEIPDYVLAEIVRTRNKVQKLNLSALINLAVINRRLTENNAKELKDTYCK